MLVASVVAWRREADGAAGRPRSGLEGRPGAAQTRQSAPRTREIVASTVYYLTIASSIARLPITRARCERNSALAAVSVGGSVPSAM